MEVEWKRETLKVSVKGVWRRREGRWIKERGVGFDVALSVERAAIEAVVRRGLHKLV